MGGKDAFNPLKDLVDLKGKVVIVSGGKGIGLETVRYLARAGAKVYLACRSEKAVSDAIQELRSTGLAPGNGELASLRLDLSDPKEAKKAAEEFLKLESRLDILINNAGMLRGHLQTGINGMSRIVVTNHLSPFIFTNTLIPLMIETARQPGTDVRIVNLTSNAHRNFPLKQIKLEKYEDLNFDSKFWIEAQAELHRYAHTKLMNIIWTKGLQKRFDESEPAVPITVIAVHPGIVKTFRKEEWPLISRLYVFVLGVEVEKGAHNSVFAAASKQVAAEREKYKGKYIEPKPRVGSISIPAPAADNDKNVEDLWRVTEDFLQTIGI